MVELLLFFSKMWHFHLPNLKLFTDYIVNITAVYPSNSCSSHLSSFMLEDIGEERVFTFIQVQHLQPTHSFILNISCLQ